MNKSGPIFTSALSLLFLLCAGIVNADTAHVQRAMIVNSVTVVEGAPRFGGVLTPSASDFTFATWALVNRYRTAQSSPTTARSRNGRALSCKRRPTR